MMRELEFVRRVDRERAQKSVGVYRGRNLLTKADVANADADHDVERLPELFSDTNLVGFADGSWGLMVDYSVIDGPDPIQ